ncbi:MAG: dephospho-CoA kinase [Acidimicrobiaceae bacterium]|jgi:dephospho-CoA kinase
MSGVVVIGLTGGIGSGKSAVATLFAERGAVVIDSDELARQVVAPGAPAHAAVVDRFGPSVAGPDGAIDRRALAAIVFDDGAALADLNAIVHPAVTAAMARRLSEEDAPGRVVVAVIPLLVEVSWQGADAVVVVDCPEDVAIERVVRDRGMTPDEVRRRMAAQVSRSERVARADRVIVNGGSWDDLRRQVDATWQWIRALPQRSGQGQGGPGDLGSAQNEPGQP